MYTIFIIFYKYENNFQKKIIFKKKRFLKKIIFKKKFLKKFQKNNFQKKNNF